MANATKNIEVGVTLAPLDSEQTGRAVALQVASGLFGTGFGRPSTEALLDLADYIIGDEPCPLAGLMAVALDPPAPAEPEVITVAGSQAAFASLPVGSVVVYPANHGFAVPDDPAYDQLSADLVWAEILALTSGAQTDGGRT